MRSRVFIILCLLGFVLTLAGCDPEDLVHRKVPESLKGLLAFGPIAGRGTGEGKFKLTDADVAIVSPKGNAVYGKGKEVEFVANVTGLDAAGPSPVEIAWTLYDERGKSQRLGSRPREKRVLPPGSYKVELAAVYRDQRIVKTRSFRVALLMAGRVALADGTGLDHAEILLGNVGGGEPITKAESGKDGRFSIEFPEEGTFRITPEKEGFSFSPMSSAIKFSQEGAPIEFSAAKGEIKNIRMTESADSNEPLAMMCPFQHVYVKFDVRSGEKPVRAEVSLVEFEHGKERLIPLEEIRDNPSGPIGIDPDAPMVGTTIPLVLAGGPMTVDYGIRVTVYDEKAASISSDSEQPVKLDLQHCFRQALSQGIALQQKGELDEAAKVYNTMQRVYNRVENQAPFSLSMQKSTFNRALAYMALALDKRPDKAENSLKYTSGSGSQPSQEVVDLGLLAKALSDLAVVLKANPRDPEALLLRGLAKQVSGEYDAAQEDYSNALSVDPGRHEARELRIQSLLKSRDDRNLLKAVEDFTEALRATPDKKCLRDGRRETLKLALKLLEAEKKKTEKPQSERSATDKHSKPEEEVLAVIPLCELSKTVDLESYVRK